VSPAKNDVIEEGVVGVGGVGGVGGVVEALVTVDDVEEVAVSSCSTFSLSYTRVPSLSP
jgi:hypothetical protein